MSRLYFHAQTNMIKDGSLKYLDYITFEHPEKQLRLTISFKESDWTLNDDGFLTGRWKELLVAIENMDGTKVQDFIDFEDKDYDLINESIPCEVGINDEEDCVHTINDLNFVVCNGDKERDFYVKNISVMTWEG